MCGVTGFIDYKKTSSVKTIQKMTNTLRHRGPDDNGVLFIKKDSYLIGIGHSRLSVIDLSPLAHQPMSYKCFTVVFNGEIYNFNEIKADLLKLGHNFSSSSDTEVILHAFEEWGTKCVDNFIGMFAITIYDEQKQVLYLIVDRVGVKPLYYSNSSDAFIFASELKALIEFPGFTKVIDTKSLQLYFEFGYVPYPYSIYKNCNKVEPGHYVTIDLRSRRTEITKYWDIKRFYEKPKLKLSYDDARQQLHNLMVSSFNYRMVSDVPVGVFLSGGYDSTAVAAILQKNSKQRLKTFTIGFSDGINEAPDAKKIAAEIGTDHTELICSTKEAEKLVESLPYFFDEPFADSSAIPTLLVSKLAREKVTVALSADGGDEIFSGYNSYQILNKYNQKLNQFSPWQKKRIKSLYPLVRVLKYTLPEKKRNKIVSFFSTINTDDYKQVADLHKSFQKIPSYIIDKTFTFNSKNPITTNYDNTLKNFDTSKEQPTYSDFITYLPGDILTKVDRSTMAFSLEGREPFLDHRIAEFAAQLPFEYKFKDGVSKRILKDIVYEYVPKSLMDRPKSGFSMPIYKWLRTDLKHLVDQYLSHEELSSSGLINADFAFAQVKKFKQGKLHYVAFVWYLLMFQMWYKRWMMNEK